MAGVINDGFILREDAALKAHLQGITVRDASAPPEGRDVKVYFRLPEQEARRRTYPYITIDLLAVARDPSREHRGRVYFEPDSEYEPPGLPTIGAQERGVTEFPIPMLLTYQVTTFARFVQHDRQLMNALMLNKLPVRFGAIEMVGTSEIANDYSMRRLEFVAGPVNADSPDAADPNKRIFRKAFTVAVPSEIFPSEIKALRLVSSIDIDLDGLST